MEMPLSITSPEVGSSIVEMIRIVVVLPAAFGPTKPKTWPESSENEMLSTATVLPNSFRKFLTWTFMKIKFFSPLPSKGRGKKLCARKSFYSSAGFCRIKDSKNNRRGFCALRAGGRTERVFDERISIEHGDVRSEEHTSELQSRQYL